MAPQVPQKQIRALYDEETITVYQAYSAAIAIPAVRDQKLSASPDFLYDRMTWIKPSWCWMMYRAGYSYKDDRQAHILALRMKHEHFQYLLSQARLTTDTTTTDHNNDNSNTKPLPVRVQWDPERSPKLGRLSYRSIQIGIGKALSQKWVEDWIVEIKDVTDVARGLKAAIDEGVSDDEELRRRGLLMEEREYVLKDEGVRKALGMD